MVNAKWLMVNAKWLFDSIRYSLKVNHSVLTIGSLPSIVHGHSSASKQPQKAALSRCGFARRLWLCYTPVDCNYVVLYICLIARLFFDCVRVHF